MSRAERIDVAKTRLLRITAAHGTAISRTLEQKIAVAGPYNQRINPHLITEARNQLISEGQLTYTSRTGIHWFHLPSVPDEFRSRRLAEQEPIHIATTQDAFTKRLGLRGFDDDLKVATKTATTRI